MKQWCCRSRACWCLRVQVFQDDRCFWRTSRNHSIPLSSSIPCLTRTLFAPNIRIIIERLVDFVSKRAFEHILRLGLQARPLHDGILLLCDAIIPALVVVLINLLDQAIGINLHDHAHMAYEVLPACFDRDFTVRPHDVVRLSTMPDLLQNTAQGGWMNGLRTGQHCVLSSQHAAGT